MVRRQSGKETTVVAERRVAKWYLCPACKGLGEMIDQRPLQLQAGRRRLYGVRHIGHMPCPRCERKLMIRVEGDRDPETGAQLYPIEECPKCLNSYAIGAGRPKNETNYPDFIPDTSTERKSHSHWFDLGVRSPGWWEDRRFVGA